MTYTVGSMISPTFAEKHASTPGAKYGVDYGEEFTYMSNHTCGTGPYQVVEWQKGEYVHMTLNEDYWRADATEAAIAAPSYAGSIKEIWRMINENQTSMNLNLTTGIVDDTYWPTTHADVMAFSFQMGLMNWTIGTNTFEVLPPTAWRGFRKMMAHLLDYDALIQAVTRGWAFQADGPIPRGIPYHNSGYWTEDYSPETAVDYWNEAMQDPDFVDVMNTIEGEILLYYPSGNIPRQWVILREQVSLLLSDGFDAMKLLPEMNTTGLEYEPQVTPVVLEWANFTKRSEPEWPDFLTLWQVGWAADYADPDNFVTPYLHSRGVFAREQGYSNSVMDDLIMQSRAETDPVARQTIYNQIQELAAYDQPSLYLYLGKEFTTFRAWLKGIGMRYNTMPSYYYIYHVYKDY
jgi:peptide/nickel transport system substrate-binding protein